MAATAVMQAMLALLSCMNVTFHFSVAAAYNRMLIDASLLTGVVSGTGLVIALWELLQYFSLLVGVTMAVGLLAVVQCSDPRWRTLFGVALNAGGIVASGVLQAASLYGAYSRYEGLAAYLPLWIPALCWHRPIADTFRRTTSIPASAACITSHVMLIALILLVRWVSWRPILALVRLLEG